MQHIGVDIVEIERIEVAMERWRGRFLQRVYTDLELKLCHEKPSSLAARFAGKEAVVKALGVKNSGIGWKDIEILSDSSGKPLICLHGKAQEQANDLGMDSLVISLSHSRDYAIAFVSGETR